MTDRCRDSGDASTDCQNFQIVPFNAIIIIIIIVIIIIIIIIIVIIIIVIIKSV